MRTSKRKIYTTFLFLLIQSVMYCQSLPVVAVYSLTSDDVGENISKTVNDLVFTFIKELRTYRVLDMRSDSKPRDFHIPDGTDYIFYGSLTGERDGIKLELVLKGGPGSVTRLISRVYENSNRILLESRILVQDLFDQSISLPDPLETEKNQILNGDETLKKPTIQTSELISVSNIDSLSGSWRGEKGIEKVMLLRGGRGVAILSSGISISLELLISGETLVIRQKGMANPRQFIDLPDAVARQAANIAPPIEWRFLITADQQMMSGTKKTVIIKNDGKNILSMESSTLEVNWTRD